jgi:hypothetical protein
MALYDHIQELRAELAAICSAKEIRQIKRELKAALAEMARIDAAFDATMTAL